ncbi:hypothetical protein [Nocardia sp. NPDC005366]|uniref:hypothetical protein n=1 Tax=Nocardia sp. NPDC005366 TaxID=3156878 RepID=UPI0033BD6AA0
MSDRSTEDEIRAEVRQFAHLLPHLLRLHAQAGNWLERRYVRKQISRTLREQRRAEETSRTHHLSWTQQMVDRYRSHALAVSERASDPSVDHARRYRDHQALSEHANALRNRIAVNDRLTVTERGIALDGLDAATTFPDFEPGRLFKNAHKVRGIEALRYRAQVARVLGADTYTQQLHTPRQPEPSSRPLPVRSAAGFTAEVREELAERISAAQQIHTGRGEGVEPSTPPPPDPADRDQNREVEVEPDRLAAVEHQLSELQADRDRLGSRVQMLQRGLDAVTVERDDIRRRFDTAEAQVAALKTRNQRLAAEIGDLRDRATPQLSAGVVEHVRHIEGERDQARRERDRYKAERDEAVGKLARSTPERERFGSRARRDQQQDPKRNGHDQKRNGHDQQQGQALREWNELVGRNMAESLADVPDHPDIAKRDLEQVDWSRFTDGSDNADELARWWASEGAEKYWAEHDARTREPGNGTQAWQPEREDPRPERNGHRRNGIERSR